MAGPMSGIRVIDLGAMIAGPAAATVLSDQGAEAIAALEAEDVPCAQAQKLQDLPPQCGSV